MSEWGAFFSYAHQDDQAEGGRLHQIAEKLETEVRQQTGSEFRIFVDRDALAWGQNWTRALREGLEESRFLIPVITPSYFTSPYCRTELETFIEKESDLAEMI